MWICPGLLKASQVFTPVLEVKREWFRLTIPGRGIGGLTFDNGIGLPAAEINLCRGRIRLKSLSYQWVILLAMKQRAADSW